MSAAAPAELPPTRTSSRPETQDLWQRYQAQGDPTAENGLVEQYLPLVKTVVGRLAMTLPSHVNLEDLHSAGLVGLLQAVRKYDPQCGASFETYARLRIRGAVLDELRRMDWVPRLVHDKARRVRNVMNEIEQATGKLPTEAQIAAALKMSLADYQRLLEEIRPATFICLDAASSQENPDGTSSYESIPDERQGSPEESTANRELVGVIMERLQQLPEMQRKVLSLYYFEDLRLREIAAIFGLTESRICQIHSQAVMNLRSYLEKLESDTAQSAAQLLA